MHKSKLKYFNKYFLYCSFATNTDKNGWWIFVFPFCIEIWNEWACRYEQQQIEIKLKFLVFEGDLHFGKN